jgi:hypothetical protein
MVHERLPGRAIIELTFNPVIPPLPRAGGLRCSVVPPYALTSSPSTLPSGRISGGATPGLEWADYQHVTRDPNPATPCPHLPAPAQVTGGRYTSQLLDTAENLPPKPSSDLRSKSYGLMRTCDVSPPAFDFADFCFRRISVCHHPSNFGARRDEK